jgi:hypothetical protein
MTRYNEVTSERPNPVTMVFLLLCIYCNTRLLILGKLLGCGHMFLVL